jgi:hypothetical protein
MEYFKLTAWGFQISLQGHQEALAVVQNAYIQSHTALMTVAKATVVLSFIAGQTTKVHR